MKNILPVLLAASVVATSCSKPHNPYEQPLSYSVMVVHNDTVAANDFTNLKAFINVQAGNPFTESVNASYTGIPANVFIKYNNASPILNSLPTTPVANPGAGLVYQLVDSIVAYGATPGTYPMQVTFSNPGSAAKTYSFNLTITGPVNWIEKLVGYYYPEPQILGDKIYVSCEIDSVKGMPGKIRIIDRVSPEWSTYGTFDTSYGTMDCCSASFNIPTQTVHGTTVSGNGYYINEEGQRKWMLVRSYSNDTTRFFSSTVTLHH